MGFATQLQLKSQLIYEFELNCELLSNKGQPKSVLASLFSELQTIRPITRRGNEEHNQSLCTYNRQSRVNCSFDEPTKSSFVIHHFFCNIIAAATQRFSRSIQQNYKFLSYTGCYYQHYYSIFNTATFNNSALLFYEFMVCN